MGDPAACRLTFGAALIAALTNTGAGAVIAWALARYPSTLPLPVDILYNEYNFAAALAVASLLTLLALAMLAVRMLIEWRARQTRPAGLEVRGAGE